ncbi:MAG: hypothetical protein ABW321_17395 [Polyangiales bacterium]
MPLRFWTLSCVAVLCAVSTTTSAQPASPPPPAAPVPQQTPTTEVTARNTPEVPPPESDSERVLKTMLEALHVYGILKPTVTFSGGAVESFSNPNAGAITAAANPVLANLPDDARLSLQVAQSRFGLWVNEKGPVRGHIEFDFIDFAKASPTVQALIRLRIATVEWNVTDHVLITAGQDWDLHAPINPFGVNLVGGHFVSGNTGFMRQQIKLFYSVPGAFEIAGAIGLQSANATPKDAAVELARTPTIALRGTALLGKAGKLGVSGIATSLRLAPGPTERRALAGAFGVFGDVTFLESFNARFEGYLGRNAANLGLLAIGQGVVSHDVAEAGFFASLRKTFDQHAVYATYSQAQVLDKDAVVPSYSYPSGGGTGDEPPALSTAALAGTGPGMRWNQALRVGYDFKPWKPLALAIEGFWYQSRHVLVAGDEERVGSPRRSALGADVAMVYTF